MRVYIAGPMSGYKNYNFQAFYDAEAWLKSQNHEPVNPARVDVELGKVIVRWIPSAADPGKRVVYEVVVPGDEPFDWKEAIERDLKLVDSCDAIYLLEGWRDSLGAQIEHDRALVRGLEILVEADETPVPEVPVDEIMQARFETVLDPNCPPGKAFFVNKAFVVRDDEAEEPEVPVDEVMQARFEGPTVVRWHAMREAIARDRADHELHLAKHNELRELLVEDTDDRTNPKDLIGVTKPSLHLVPGAALAYVAKVMQLGADKYGVTNWRENDVRHTVYLSAALRHIYQAVDGATVDDESGLPHEAHAAACMLILLDAMAGGNLIEDLGNPGPAAETFQQLTTTSQNGAGQ